MGGRATSMFGALILVVHITCDVREMTGSHAMNDRLDQLTDAGHEPVDQHDDEKDAEHALGP
jgi:hypothetical protein